MEQLGFRIEAETRLCRNLRSRGYDSFITLAKAVNGLRYGRVDLAGDPAQVIDLGRGTCSSKHRLLAMVAHECGHREIELAVGIYLMSELNTPGVGECLATAGLDFIPEAHCYLISHGKRLDFTGLSKGPRSPFDSIVEEHIVEPRELATAKISLHKKFIKKWATERSMAATEAWKIREACIEILSKT